jgi:hypothetical protein
MGISSFEFDDSATVFKFNFTLYFLILTNTCHQTVVGGYNNGQVDRSLLTQVEQYGLIAAHEVHYAVNSLAARQRPDLSRDLRHAFFPQGHRRDVGREGDLRMRPECVIGGICPRQDLPVPLSHKEQKVVPGSEKVRLPGEKTSAIKLHSFRALTSGAPLFPKNGTA